MKKLYTPKFHIILCATLLCATNSLAAAGGYDSEGEGYRTPDRRPDRMRGLRAPSPARLTDERETPQPTSPTPPLMPQSLVDIFETELYKTPDRRSAMDCELCSPRIKTPEAFRDTPAIHPLSSHHITYRALTEGEGDFSDEEENIYNLILNIETETDIDALEAFNEHISDPAVSLRRPEGLDDLDAPIVSAIDNFIIPAVQVGMMFEKDIELVNETDSDGNSVFHSIIHSDRSCEQKEYLIKTALEAVMMRDDIVDPASVLRFLDAIGAYDILVGSDFKHLLRVFK